MKQCERCNEPATVTIETTKGTQQTDVCESCSRLFIHEQSKTIWRVKEQVSPERQAYQAYLAECAKTDAGKHGAVLRIHTPKEQELYDAWQGLFLEDEEQG